MNKYLQSLRAHLPPWAVDWLDVLVPAVQVVLIVLVAWLAMRLVRRLIRRVAAAYALPSEVVLLSRRTVGFVVYGGSLLWCNARVSAAGFYARQGFAVHGEQFVDDRGVPHLRMWRELSARPTSS